MADLQALLQPGCCSNHTRDLDAEYFCPCLAIHPILGCLARCLGHSQCALMTNLHSLDAALSTPVTYLLGISFPVLLFILGPVLGCLEHIT